MASRLDVLQVLDALEDSLKLAIIDENWKYRVGRQTELRAKFNAPDLTIRFTSHFQIIEIDGKEITLGAMATDEQIAAEIARIRPMGVQVGGIMVPKSAADEARLESLRNYSEKPMAKPLNLQGLSGKLSKLKHDVEFDAGKLAARIDTVSTRKDAAFSKGHQYLDTTEAHVGEVEQFVTDLEAATNGDGNDAA